MDKVRFGVVGTGGMGAHHIKCICGLENATMAAICDNDRARVDRAAQGLEVAKFTDYNEMFASGKIDAVLIATPHYFHGEIARSAFAKGIHVLSEKPQSVSVGDARRTNAAHEKVRSKVKYGIMFQMRTNPLYKKMRDLIQSGDLGDVTRITWIVTNWFRSHAYYASGGWRATWAGEGGGVLLNQCPHNLDLLQWIPNLMPSRITAVGFVGKTHPIEVEDEASAIMEYPNGAIGHFITSTGEAPGTDRLEICGDRGKLIAERGQLLFSRTRKSVRETNEKTPEAFPQVETWDINVPIPSGGPDHRVVTQAFVNAILRDEPMIAEGEEGTKGLEIGNAMAMAALTRTPVDLPVDGAKYDQFLKDMIAKYGGRKTLAASDKVVDVSTSFH